MHITSYSRWDLVIYAYYLELITIFFYMASILYFFLYLFFKTDCGGQTLRWLHDALLLLFPPLCHPLPLILGRTWDLFLTSRLQDDGVGTWMWLHLSIASVLLASPCWWLCRHWLPWIAQLQWNELCPQPDYKPHLNLWWEPSPGWCWEQPFETLKKGPTWVEFRLLTHENRELIHVCCFMLLQLCSFVMQQ